MIQKFMAALKQIEEALNIESLALAEHTHPDFNDINAKKARGLQALTQALTDEGRGLDEMEKNEVKLALQQLQAKLDRNRQLLEIHMEAVGELVEMINSAAHARETDGTYDPFCLATGDNNQRANHGRI